MDCNDKNNKDKIWFFLEKNKFLARGSHRFIYTHETIGKYKCLKIALPEGQKILRSQNKHWYKRIKPLSCFNENKKEIKGYKVLNKKNNEIFEFIPRFYGVIKTNLGKAIVVDYFLML